MQVNMHEAKAQLSKLAQLAWQGEEVIIAKSGKPFLKLVPYEEPAAPEPPAPGTPRKPGSLKGRIWIAPDFDETDEEIIAAFEGKPSTERRQLGVWKGRIWMAPDFDETDEEIIEAFEGKWSSDFC